LKTSVVFMKASLLNLFMKTSVSERVEPVISARDPGFRSGRVASPPISLSHPVRGVRGVHRAFGWIVGTQRGVGPQQAKQDTNMFLNEQISAIVED